MWGEIHMYDLSLFFADLLVVRPMLGLTFSTAIAWASASRASEDDIYDDDVDEDGDKNMLFHDKRT